MSTVVEELIEIMYKISLVLLEIINEQQQNYLVLFGKEHTISVKKCYFFFEDVYNCKRIRKEKQDFYVIQLCRFDYFPVLEKKLRFGSSSLLSNQDENQNAAKKKKRCR